MYATDPGGLDRLTVDATCAGVGLAPQAHAQPFAQHGLHQLPVAA